MVSRIVRGFGSSWLGRGLSLLSAAFFWYPVFVLYVISGSGNNPYAFYTFGDLFRPKRFADFRAYKRQQGFTLVELAIVLVILGLLVGGVITGQNLIRAAELRSVTVEFAQYQSAVLQFRDRYHALPGDMPNATLFWGAMTNCGVDNPSGTGTQTCNGNGNGQIGIPAAAGRTGEMFAFWQHLANANLIEGSYNGIANAGGQAATTLGLNAPKSKLSNGGWSTWWVGDRDTANTTFFAGRYGNILGFGAASSNSWTHGTIFSPEEAWNIDTKVDDGKPETGNLRSFKSLGGTGTTHCSNTATQEYALQNNGQRCALMFLQAF
jgi:prepilin-type N-terminal cleavage/methylation domain-containing protein